MPHRFTASAALAIFIAVCARGFAADPPDYSKEAAVVQNMATKVSFSADGAREWQETLSVRIQSEAAVRQFGVLGLSYGADNEQVKIDYVRVRKADGSVVETPDSSVQDVAAPVATTAPTYSDIRQKQIPVKGLAAGDVLEYSFRSSQRKPEVPGEFWYDQYFAEDGVILNQTLEISVPKEKFVQVSSPKLKAEVHDEGDRRVYVWQHSHLAPSKPDDKNKPVSEGEPPKAQLTTFRSWEEVGSWWATLASPQAAVTPAIQDKAKELTAGLTSDSEKARAIYKYVSMKFRYISISLGAGKYRPHGAAEVLANQYGDCKDKHTLFAALLNAAGIPAWPALIGAGIKFDASVPSPAQFNHVITVLPQEGKYIWLDTTAEVAPFGLLSQAVRDEQALVIPSDGKPFLFKTPIDPPFKTNDTAAVKSVLAADGTLTGQFDFQVAGDNALLLRGVFRQLAPSQWQALAQQMSYALGYAGDVSGVEVENLEDADKPFRYSYEYSRKNYSDWEEHKITPPVPPMGFGPGEEAEKPKEPFWVGDPGTLTYRASVQLPNGFSTDTPPDITVSSAFADYSAHYSVKDGTLTAERTMVVKRSKVGLDEWAEYQTFSKGIRADQGKFIALSETASSKATGPDLHPEADRLLDLVSEAVKAHKVNEARDLLSQVERLNPKQAKLWAIYSYLAMTSGHLEEAITDGRKEIQLHPDEIPAYRQLTMILIHAGRFDEAIDAWRGALTITPEDPTAASELAKLLIQAKRYSETPAVLEKAIAAAPDRYDLQVLRAQALLRDGRKEEGLTEAKKIASATSEPSVLNNLAYYLSDTGTDNGIAGEWARKAIDQTEKNTAQADLASFERKDLAAVTSLAAEWDTLGWIYFQENDLAKAEKYVDAAWQLGQRTNIANHLGQIYDKQGRHAAAIHMWRLALATNNSDANSLELLRKAGAPVIEPMRGGKGAARSAVPAAEELGILRTIKIPALPKQTGNAEFFILISRQGIESAQMIGESEAFKNAAQQLQNTKYEFPFPDLGPEKIIRRGILSCSLYTDPSCQFTLLLPSATDVDGRKAQQSSSGDTLPEPGVISPTLRTKVEPEYSEAAKEAKLEGDVWLSVVVNQEGVPEDVVVLKSLGMGLDEKARESVLKWRFNPGTKDGKPVRVRAKVEVSFYLLQNAQ